MGSSNSDKENSLTSMSFIRGFPAESNDRIINCVSYMGNNHFSHLEQNNSNNLF